MDDGLARTPPIGWNSWNAFRQDINEQVIRKMSDALIATGMRDAGNVYLTIDAIGVQVLKLVVTDTGDGTFRDHADWADAHLSI